MSLFHPIREIWFPILPINILLVSKANLLVPQSRKISCMIHFQCIWRKINRYLLQLTEFVHLLSRRQTQTIVTSHAFLLEFVHFWLMDGSRYRPRSGHQFSRWVLFHTSCKNLFDCLITNNYPSIFYGLMAKKAIVLSVISSSLYIKVS